MNWPKNKPTFEKAGFPQSSWFVKLSWTIFYLFDFLVWNCDRKVKSIFDHYDSWLFFYWM